MTKIYTGVVEDPRPKEEKRKDWKASELLAGAPVVTWEEKTQWKTYKRRNQKRTSSCVPQSVAKLLEINEKSETGKEKVLSATKAYADRSNKGAGSYLHEMLKYAVENKYTTEDRMPSQGLASDLDMERIAADWNRKDESIAKKYAAKVYLLVDNDMDEIAHFIQEGMGVAILIYGTGREWGKKYPVILDRKLDRFNAPIRHCVSVVDFGLIQGKRFLKIEDSAHFGGKFDRWIDEDWLLERCYAAGMVYDKPGPLLPELPHFNFTTSLFYGMRRNEDVKNLQNILKLEGFFPEAIPSTGNYLEITRRGVEKYQRFYQVAKEWELNLVRGRIVGPKTKQQLNGL